MSGASAANGVKTVLFAPALAEDLENMAPVAQALARLSHGTVASVFICLDAVYRQNLERALIAGGVSYFVLHPRADSPLPLVHRSLRRRLAFSLLNRRELARIARGYDAFVCGVGGLCERIMAAGARQAGKPTFDLLGTLYARAGVTAARNRLLLALHRMAPALGFLLPGAQIGATAVMKHVFVMGEYAAATMRLAGVRSAVHATGMPRHAALFRTLPSVPREPRQARTVLFLPGAFRWHHQEDLHQFQMATLRELAQATSAFGGDYRVVVKLHPRDNREAYEPLRASGLVDLREGQLIDALPDAFLVVGMVSTGLLESAAAGRLTVCFMSGLPQKYWRGTEEFPFLPRFRSSAELTQFLLRIRDPEAYDAELERQRREIDAFIAPTTETAADEIAKVILQELER